MHSQRLQQKEAQVDASSEHLETVQKHSPCNSLLTLTAWSALTACVSMCMNSMTAKTDSAMQEWHEMQQGR